jgi:hypothetical protein
MNRDPRPDTLHRGPLPLPAVLFLVVALLVGGLIPVGWMPNAQGGDRSPLVICTGSGVQLVALHRPAHPGQPHTPQHHDACAFAGHNLASAPTLRAIAIPEAFFRAASRQPAFEAALAAVARHREQAARAPPISA